MLLIEKKGDLFESTESLAHCVSRDFHMSAGIAKGFKSKFSHQQSLRGGSWLVGDAARVSAGNRYIFYLVTKERYYDLPTECALESTLVQLAKWCELLSIHRLDIPRLASGRDRVDWDNVVTIIKRAFRDCDITITVYVP